MRLRGWVWTRESPPSEVQGFLHLEVLSRYERAVSEAGANCDSVLKEPHLVVGDARLSRMAEARVRIVRIVAAAITTAAALVGPVGSSPAATSSAPGPRARRVEALIVISES